MTPNQSNPAQTAPDGFMPMAEVVAFTSLRRSTVLKEAKEGRFPRPVQLTRGRIGWLRGEVNAWVAERVAGARRTGDGAQTTGPTNLRTLP